MVHHGICWVQSSFRWFFQNRWNMGFLLDPQLRLPRKVEHSNDTEQHLLWPIAICLTYLLADRPAVGRQSSSWPAWWRWILWSGSISIRRCDRGASTVLLKGWNLCRMTRTNMIWNDQNLRHWTAWSEMVKIIEIWLVLQRGTSTCSSPWEPILDSQRSAEKRIRTAGI